MPWQKGQSGNPKGRSPVIWNSLSGSLKRIGDEIKDDDGVTNWDKLVRRLFEYALGAADIKESIQAAKVLIDAGIKTIEINQVMERVMALEDAKRAETQTETKENENEKIE